MIPYGNKLYAVMLILSDRTLCLRVTNDNGTKSIVLFEL